MNEASHEIRMVPCSDCGRSVPEMNMAVHQLTACAGRARPPAFQNNDTDDSMEVEQITPSAPLERDFSNSTPRHRTSPGSPPREVDVVDLITPNPPKVDNADEDDDIDVHEVVDLSQDDSPSLTAAPSSSNWSCPQCTLLNPQTSARCEACNFPNPERPADPVRRERLVDDGFSFGGTSRESPLVGSYAGGGAVLGGLLGGAGAYMRGRPLSSGLFEGAITGALGGSVMDQMFREATLLDTANGRSSRPSETETPPTRPRTRSSYRIVTRNDPNGIRVIRQGGSGITRGGLDDPMMAFLMSQMLANRGPGPNVDGMSYEQLLQAFGDGSENRGAEETTITSLPTATLKNVETELPKDARQCLICLEDFKNGDVRKMMPCLHGFHEDCVDKWLLTNGSCPICKHSINN